MAFAPLFELNDQFQAKNGHNLTGGFLRVYLAFTDDLADTYSDYEGTRNPANIVIDDNGRAVVICDSDKAYRLEVYDAEGMLLWTQEPVFCTGTGGGGGTGTSTIIESTDQSINVVSSTAGGVTTYDIGIASDTKELLEWAETDDSIVSDGDVFPEVNEGTMESEHDMGIFLHGNQVYHVTNSFTVYPTGYGINYDTLNVKLMLDSTELCSRSYDIDNSVSDPVECEFSYDVATTADGYLHWTISGASAFSSTTAKMQIHRVYSGLAAVPSSYATKIYVDSSVSSKIDYSALEYNTANYITGISGSAIGGLDSAAVSSIASSYAESAASGKLDNSASSLWYPMTGNPSGFLTGDLSEYATTAYVDSSVSSKVDQSAFDNCCSSMSGYVSSLQNDVSSISSIVSAVTGQTGNYIDWSASGQFQPSGHYMSSSDISAYVPFSSMAGENNVITSISGSAIGGTASGGKTYTGVWPVVVDNTADSISVLNKTLCVDETLTAYESAGSAVIGVVESSVLSSLTSYVPYSSISGEDNTITSINGSAIGSTGGGVVTAMGTAQTGDSAYVTSLNETKLSAYTASFAGAATYAYYDGYGQPLDQSANVKTSAMTAYQTVADMSAYQVSGDYAYNSAISGKLDKTAQVVTATATGNYTNGGFIVTGVSGVNGKALLAVSAGSAQCDSKGNTITATYQPTSAMTAYQPVGTYIYESALGWAEV